MLHFWLKSRFAIFTATLFISTRGFDIILEYKYDNIRIMPMANRTKYTYILLITSIASLIGCNDVAQIISSLLSKLYMLTMPIIGSLLSVKKKVVILLSFLINLICERLIPFITSKSNLFFNTLSLPSNLKILGIRFSLKTIILEFDFSSTSKRTLSTSEIVLASLYLFTNSINVFSVSFIFCEI
ncbi:hypothetical protein CAAU_2256 [Caloramator australicus RC3]|uniref:Uncharacterized protein n=1 Tax=Caloramator australicus RC3 TaxID=857293 RepID=I7K9M3_9CLOT|nr:hypothetical protein CAAU_2256 [Caloramator australicus RC3]